jgi:hypothetical protein
MEAPFLGDEGLELPGQHVSLATANMQTITDSTVA